MSLSNAHAAAAGLQREPRYSAADAVLDSIVDAVLVIDGAYAVKHLNPAAVALTGWSLVDAVGQPLDDLARWADADGSVVQQAVEELHAGVSTKVTVSLPRHNKTILASVSASPILDSRGESTGAVLVVRDVTHFRKTEEQYQRARHLGGMQRLAEGVAHNLNNLVTVIAGYSESLANTLQGFDAQRREARMIQQATERAAFLIRQLMLFSRRQPAEPKLLDLNTCFAVTEKMLRPMLGCDVGLITSFESSLHRVDADPRHIEQILMTLVLNAREAMPEGGTICIRTSNVNLDEQLAMNYVDVRPGEYALLEVSDTGEGMNDSTQGHLFEPFFSTKEPRKAIGLSLAALYGMVKQAGGHVAFESDPGNGTRFMVYLPKAEEAPVRPRGEPAYAAARADAETVLVVEDEVSMRLLTREVLLQQGYRVMEASNGSQALQLLAEHDGPVHLVVTDIIMPGISGFDLASRIEGVYPNVKMLFMSAFSQYALTHHGAVPGRTHLLQKPFTTGTLIAKVREALA